MDNLSLNDKYNLIYPLLFPGEEVKVLDNSIIDNIIPNKYFVTSFGRAFSIRNNNIYEHKHENITHNSIGQRVYLSSINSKAIRISIYRLVLMAFRPINNMELFEVKHIDGNPENNRLDNLEWRYGSYLNYVNDKNNPFVEFPDIEIFNDEIIVPITDMQVPNIKQIYFVSNYGKVLSISGNCNKSVIKLIPNLVKGYHRYTLYLKNNTPKHILAHRLVMLTFRYRPDFEKLFINHKDLNTINNYVDINNINNDNIEWCTPQYNAQYSVYMENRSDQFNKETVFKIKDMLDSGNSVKFIANRFNVSLDTIYNIKNNKKYKSILGGLDQWRI